MEKRMKQHILCRERLRSVGVQVGERYLRKPYQAKLGMTRSFCAAE